MQRLLRDLRESHHPSPTARSGPVLPELLQQIETEGDQGRPQRGRTHDLPPLRWQLRLVLPGHPIFLQFSYSLSHDVAPGTYTLTVLSTMLHYDQVMIEIPEAGKRQQELKTSVIDTSTGYKRSVKFPLKLKPRYLLSYFRVSIECTVAHNLLASKGI